MKEIKNLKKKVMKWYTAFLTVMSITYWQGILAMATFSNPEEIKIQEGADPGSVMGKFVGLIFILVSGGGLVLVIFGVVKLVQAFNDDNAQAKIASALMIGSGLVLCFLKKILQGMGVIQ